MVAARRHGFSLVEVIVALTLLGVGLLGVAGTGLLASRLVRETQLREAMLSRASSLLDSLVAHAGSGGGVVPLDRYRLAWQATERSVEVQALLADTPLFVLRAAR